MTGPPLTRAEHRAFVLALMDVEPQDWWWDVAYQLSLAPRSLVFLAGRARGDDRRECLLAAADLLRPRWTREEAEHALVQLAVMNARAISNMASREAGRDAVHAEERVIRMAMGDEP
jgi:hypothetical protein